MRMVSEEVLQLIHEVMDVLKPTINRSKAYVGYSVQPMELFHYFFTNLRTPNLSLALILKMEFDTVDDLFNDVETDRPFLARLLQAIKDLEAIEWLSTPVFLDHGGQGLFRPLAGGEPFMASKALPPAPDRLLVFALPGIDDLAFQMVTERTLHKKMKLASGYERLPISLKPFASSLLPAKPLDPDTGFFEHPASQGVGIAFFVNDPLDPSINDHLGADGTGMVGAVKRGSADRHAMIGRLDDRVLFGVQAPAEFMALSGRNSLLLPETAHIKAVLQA